MLKEMDAKILSESGEQILQNRSFVNRNVISVLRTLNEKNTSRNKAEAVLVSIMLLGAQVQHKEHCREQ